MLTKELTVEFAKACALVAVREYWGGKDLSKASEKMRIHMAQCLEIQGSEMLASEALFVYNDHVLNLL